MSIAIAVRPPDKSFLGDLHAMEVHDLLNEKPRCRLGSVVADGFAVVFGPDTLARAEMEGFGHCPFCIG